MRRPVAVALPPKKLHPLLVPMKNAGALLVDALYGTPKRTRMTMLFALAIGLLGMSLTAAEASAFCATAIG